MRLGLLADTHVDFATVGEDVYAELAEAGVTRIIVCGDVGGASLAERLESIAPTSLVRGGADGVDIGPDRLVVDFGGVKVGVIHMLPGSTDDAEAIAELFGEPVSVVAPRGNPCRRDPRGRRRLAREPRQPECAGRGKRAQPRHRRLRRQRRQGQARRARLTRRTSMLDLSGGWVAFPSDDELRRQFADDGFDDTAWTPIDVPGHWRTSAGFEESDGPLLYRRRFTQPRPDSGRRTFLCFDGLFYQGDVWFDGSYLGDTEGYFVPYSFEITDALTEREDHVVAVEATCSPQPDKSAKRNLTGVFQHWDCIDPEWNPGGIWRPVHITGDRSDRIHRRPGPVCRGDTRASTPADDRVPRRGRLLRGRVAHGRRPERR